MSFLFADAGDLHRTAHRIRAEAASLRSIAATLLKAVEATRWHSRGASACRERASSVARAICASAVALERSADSLDRHADRATAAHALRLAAQAATAPTQVAISAARGAVDGFEHVLHLG